MYPRPSDAKRIFLEAVENHPPADWPRFLEEATEGDLALRGFVEALLESHRESNQMLDGTGVVATIAHPPITERPGTEIGHYKLLKEIGEGGMGVVFMAHQREPVRRRVALKIIKPGMDSREVMGRFKAEEQTLAMMDHPNIAKMHDAGATESGRPYFVMELVNGIRITEYCDNNDLMTRRRLELFVSVCNAVQHAHQKGIIHRDIKPSNILVTLHDGVPIPKIIDFGIAKAINQELTANTVFTGFGQMVGTPMYMSPEQAELNAADVDTRSDVYSLGVLLYELLTGTTPFDRERMSGVSFDEFRRIIREEEPPRPSTRLSTLEAALETVAEKHHTDPRKLCHQIRGELDWIVMKALEKDRNRRYETVSHFAKDIERYLNDEAVEACPPSISYRLRTFVRRNRVAILTGVIVAAALIVGSVGATWQAVRAGNERDRARKAEQLAEQRLERALNAERAARREATNATNEAAISTAVNAFINTDLLAAASPDKQPNRDLKVREVLDRASQSVQVRFRGQPLLEAAIRCTLGRAYKSLGEYERAEQHLMRAHEVRLQQLGINDRKTLETMDAIADLRLWQGRYADAEKLSTEALDIKRHILEPEHPDILAGLDLVARCHRAQGRFSNAEKLQTEVFEICQRVFGPEHRRTLRSAGHLVACYLAQGRSDQAEKLAAEVLEICQRRFGPEHPETVANMQSLASCYLKRGRYPNAEHLLAEVLEIRRRTLGPEHYDTLHTMSAIAECYHRQGDFDQAEQRYAALLQIRLRAFGPEHPGTFSTMDSLASCHDDHGDYEAAEKLRAEALEGSRRTLGAEHNLTLRIMSNLAVCYEKQGRLAEAGALQNEVLQIRLRTLGSKHPETLASMNNLATCQEALGRYDEAKKLFATALDVFRRTLGSEHPDTLRVMSNLANCYVELGCGNEAEELLAEALEISRRLLGAEHPQTLAMMNNLARCYNHLDRHVEAAKLYADVLKIVRRVLGPDHPNTLATMNNLASTLKDQDRYDEAQRLWIEVCHGSRRSLGREHPNTLVFMNNLAGCYVTLGRYADAEKLHVETLETRRRVLGSEHPATRRSVDNLAQCYALWARSLAASPVQEVDRLNRALELAEKATTLHPDSGEVWHCLAWTLYRAGDWKASIEASEKSCALDKEGGSIYASQLLLAMSNWQLGDRDRAMQHYHEAEACRRNFVSVRAHVKKTWNDLHEEARLLLGIDSMPSEEQSEEQEVSAGAA